MGILIPFYEADPTCSFCKAPRSQVKHMIKNNRTGRAARYICDGCVKFAMQRMELHAEIEQEENQEAPAKE